MRKSVNKFQATSFQLGNTTSYRKTIFRIIINVDCLNLVISLLCESIDWIENYCNSQMIMHAMYDFVNTSFA